MIEILKILGILLLSIIPFFVICLMVGVYKLKNRIKRHIKLVRNRKRL